MDCYVRLHASELSGVSLSHLQSEIDPFPLVPSAPWAHRHAHELEVSGYSEWIVHGPRSLSIGWNWMLHVDQSLSLDPDSLRMNIMLVGEDGCDRGLTETTGAVLALVERTPWQETVLSVIRGGACELGGSRAS